MFKSFQQHAEEQPIENYEEFFSDYDRPYQFSEAFYDIYTRIKAKMTKKQLTMYTNLKSCLKGSTAPLKRAFICSSNKTFIVDSGASVHLISFEDLDDQETKAIEIIPVNERFSL